MLGEVGDEPVLAGRVEERVSVLFLVAAELLDQGDPLVHALENGAVGLRDLLSQLDDGRVGGPVAQRGAG